MPIPAHQPLFVVRFSCGARACYIVTVGQSPANDFPLSILRRSYGKGAFRHAPSSYGDLALDIALVLAKSGFKVAARHLIPKSPPSKSWTLADPPDVLAARFRKLQTRQDVADLLDIPYWQLDWLVRRSPPSDRYSKVEVRKRRGGVRQISVPQPGLKAAQKKLAAVLSATYRAPPCVNGFVGKRGILQNAQRHVGQRWVLNVDIKDFFPSITFPRIRGMFLAKPYRLPQAAATLLAQICCTPPTESLSTEIQSSSIPLLIRSAGVLPQGAPTSPVVSNMLCARLDGELMALARKHRVTYTRFADDLTFSCSRRKFPDALATKDSANDRCLLGFELEDILRGNGFEPNPLKLRLQGANRRQEVTGIVVNHLPNVDRSRVREIRAMLHAWRKYGLDAAEAEFREKYDDKHRAPGTKPVAFHKVVRGKIEFLKMVRGSADPLVKKLYCQYRELAGLPLDVERSRHERLRDTLWVLESVRDVEGGDAEISTGTGFTVKSGGIITCAHVIADGLEAFRWNTPKMKFPVKVLFKCDQRDLALIEAPTPGDVLELSAPREPGIEERALAIGFPNYNDGDPGYFLPVHVTGHRSLDGQRRCLVNGPLIAGMSGGPVVDENDKVIGVISHGALTRATANDTEMHAFIPVTTLIGFLADAATTLSAAPGVIK